MVSRIAISRILIDFDNTSGCETESGFVNCLREFERSTKQDVLLTDVDLINPWIYLAEHCSEADEIENYASVSKLVNMFGEGALFDLKAFITLYKSCDDLLRDRILKLMKLKCKCLTLAGVFNELRKINKLTLETIEAVEAFQDNNIYPNLELAIYCYPDACDVVLSHPECKKPKDFASVVALLERRCIIFSVDQIINVPNLANLYILLNALSSFVLTKQVYEEIISNHYIFCSDEMVQVFLQGSVSILNLTMMDQIIQFCKQAKDLASAVRVVARFLQFLNKKFSEIKLGLIGSVSARDCISLSNLANMVRYKHYHSTAENTKPSLSIHLQCQLREQDVSELLSLFSTGYFAEYDHVFLDLSGNKLDETRLQVIAQLISSIHGPDNLHLELGCNSIGLKGLEIIKNALEKRFKEVGKDKSLSLNFSNSISYCFGWPKDYRSLILSVQEGAEGNSEIDLESAKVLTSLFQFAPKNFCLKLNSMDDKGTEEIVSKLHLLSSGSRITLEMCTVKHHEIIAKALMSNTAIVEFDFKCRRWDSKLEEYMINRFTEIIQHCCKRNQLIQKYPELENIIKKISMSKKIYLPHKDQQNAYNPSSLKVSSAFFFSELPYVFTEDQQNRFPQDLIDFVNEIRTINTDLQAKLPKECVIRKLCG